MDQAKQSFEYSSKNIPIHSQREHRLHLLRSVEKFRHNLSWRVFHFLNPSNGCQKKTFGLLSSKPAPVVHELKPFFSKLENLMRGLEYKKFSNPIQKKLKEDCQKIAQNADVEQRNIVESLDLTCRDLCRADGRHIQSTMARTQVWLQPPGEMREHWAGRVYLGPEGLQHPLHHLLGYSWQGSNLQSCHEDMQIVHPGKFFILYHPRKASLNQRMELFSPCLHRDRHLLFPRRKKKKWNFTQDGDPSLCVSSSLVLSYPVIFRLSNHNLYLNHVLVCSSVIPLKIGSPPWNMLYGNIRIKIKCPPNLFKLK